MPNTESTQLFLIIIILMLVFGYLTLLKNYLDLKKRRKEYELEALNRAQKIIDRAIVQASDIISRSQVIGGEFKSKIAENGEEISERQKNVYQNVLDEVKKELSQVVQNASQDIKEDAQQEIQAFASSIREETIATQEEVKEKISDEYLRLEGELGEYKKARMLKAEEEIQNLISEVAQKTLGKSLNSKDHKDLIIRSLEEAMKNDVFK